MVEALSADLSVGSLMQYYDVCDFAFNFNLIVHLFEPLTATGAAISFLLLQPFIQYLFFLYVRFVPRSNHLQ
jgi:hypothetical protein